LNSSIGWVNRSTQHNIL